MERVFRIVLLMVLCLLGPISTASARAVTQIVREEHTLVINGVTENWQLVWIGKPLSTCGPESVDFANTCPCSGFAYGESGNLWLVRKRHGREIERMDLKLLFGHFDYPDVEGVSILQRWPEKDSDWTRDDRGDPRLVKDIRQRPKVQIMVLKDYDHDGHATEFLIQVGTLPCGKHQFAAIGLSAKNPHLHALTTVEKPKSPLMMAGWAWQALLKAKKPTTVTVWNCGDHASEVQSDLVVAAHSGNIHVRHRELTCPIGKSQKLISEEDLDSTQN